MIGLGVKVAAGASLVHLVAAEAPTGVENPTDIFGLLIQSGPFALILLLILTDKIAPTGERNRLREENEAYKKSTQELNNRLLELMPPLLAFTEKLKELVNIVEKIDERRGTRRGGSD